MSRPLSLRSLAYGFGIRSKGAIELEKLLAVERATLEKGKR